MGSLWTRNSLQRAEHVVLACLQMGTVESAAFSATVRARDPCLLLFPPNNFRLIGSSNMRGQLSCERIAALSKLNHENDKWTVCIGTLERWTKAEGFGGLRFSEAAFVSSITAQATGLEVGPRSERGP